MISQFAPRRLERRHAGPYTFAMRLATGLFAFLVLSALPAAGQELRHPDPGLPPIRVVEIQLEALQRNDRPVPDAGIAQTWAFAHPANRRMTGPLERFALMIKGPHYRLMLGHREHTIDPVFQSADLAVFAVRLVAADGRHAAFQWRVAKVAEGPYAGSWMTVGVSPPLNVKDSI